MQIELTHTVDATRISDMIVTAFEGGANHWLERAELVQPEKPLPLPGPVSPWYARPEIYEHPGLLIKLTDCEGDVHALTPAHMAAGFKLMAEQFESSHWADFLEENEDADTADVWLQLCVFGDVTYG